MPENTIKIGELFIKELLSRNQPKEIFSYERLQEIKSIDNIFELKGTLSDSRFYGFDESENISDIVDQTLITLNRRDFLSKISIWFIIIIAILAAIIIYLLTDHLIVSFIPLSIIFYYSYIRSLEKSRIKNKKYLAQIKK